MGINSFHFIIQKIFNIFSRIISSSLMTLPHCCHYTQNTLTHSQHLQPLNIQRLITRTHMHTHHPSLVFSPPLSHSTWRCWLCLLFTTLFLLADDNNSVDRISVCSLCNPSLLNCRWLCVNTWMNKWLNLAETYPSHWCLYWLKKCCFSDFLS